MNMSKRDIFSILTGLLLNVLGYLLGSNIVMMVLHDYFSIGFQSEIKSFILWNISGSFIAWFGNVIGLVIVTERKIKYTIFASIVGLAVSILLSFFHIPILFFLGMASIFLGTYFGYIYDASYNSNRLRNH
jgi:hypothetical protein